MVGIVTITLMIEDIIGLDISLPRKTVDWTMATMEMMELKTLIKAEHDYYLKQQTS